MKKIIIATIIASSLFTTLTPTISYADEINFSRKNSGIVDILYNTGSQNKVKLIVTKGDINYYYNVFNNPKSASFPLQLGNGNYKVQLLENTSGSKYKKISSKSDSLNLDDTSKVFLNSIQEIEWYNGDSAIALADTLISEANLAADASTEDKFLILFDYVISTIDYDYEKIATLSYNYIPDIDLILEEEAGICYDYSVLLASMCRSQGIKVKLIKGYSSVTDVYHAWNEIYFPETDEWVVVDSTTDAYYKTNGYEYNYAKNRQDYIPSYEY